MGQNTEEIESANIGSSIKAEKIEIFMPPEVYESSPDISLKKLTADKRDEPKDSKGIGDPYQVTTDDRLNAPVLLTLDYEPADLPEGANEKNIYIATRQDGEWIPVEGGFVDIEKNQVSVAVEHFSDFWAMVKQTGDAIYDVVESVGIDTTTTGISYSRLPDDIKEDLSGDNIKPEGVSAVTKYEFSLVTKIGHSLNSYLNGLTKLSSLAIAAVEGTKRAILEAMAEAVAYVAFEYTGNEKGTYTLILYDTADLVSGVGMLALDAASGTSMMALKGTDYLASRVMDDINADMHDAFRDLISLNPNSTGRLKVYSVCVDSQPEGRTPGIKGMIFYYFDEDSEQWINYYEDLLYWVIEFEPEEEVSEESSQEGPRDYDPDDYKDEEPDIESDKEEVDTDISQTEEDECSQSSEDTQGIEKEQDKDYEDEVDTEGEGEDPEDKPQSPVQVYLDPDGSGDYETLEQAIKDVAPGSSIFLDSGTFYLSNYLNINKDIEIVGTRIDLTEIRYDGHGDHDDFIDYHGDSNYQGEGVFILQDITFTSEGDDVHNILDIGGGNIQISDCRFTGAYTGIDVEGSTAGYIRDCEFYDNRSKGVNIYGDSDTIVESNIFNENGGAIRLAADVRFSGNDCSFNLFDAITVYGSNDILIEDNLISNNGDDGIYFGEDALGIARDNDIFGNGNGIWAGVDSAPTVEYNIIYENENYGICFTDNTSGTVRYNECYSNNIGIAVQLDATPELIDNYCYDNQEADYDD